MNEQIKNKIKEKIIFKAVSGSKLYGTDGNNSDVDIKGVFLPEINDLILEKAPKHYQLSTGDDHSKNLKDDVDETYYSLQYFMELLAKGDTNALDILFASSNQNAVIETSDIWEEIVNNQDKLITKNMKAYIGYCKSQSIKYSLKGDKLNNYLTFKNFLEKYITCKNIQGNNITLKEALESDNNKIKLNIPSPGEDRIKFNSVFGDHCYFVVANNKEEYISISDVNFCLSEIVTSTLHKVNRVICSYGKRAENAAKDNGADYKALSHAVRVLFQVEEILKTGTLKFPLKDVDFIKSIKYKTTNMTYENIIDWIDNKINQIDVMLKNCKIRETVDINWINKFILKIYK